MAIDILECSKKLLILCNIYPEFLVHLNFAIMTDFEIAEYLEVLQFLVRNRRKFLIVSMRS